MSKDAERVGANRGKAAKRAAPRRQARTEEDKQQKLQAILKAALEEFSQKGFAEARLDEIARKAGVAKGTVYLYAPSKQALFESVVRFGIGPTIREIETGILASSLPIEDKLRRAFAFFIQEILNSPRGEIVRLVLREAHNFPEIASFHYREFVSWVMGMMSNLAKQAVETGEFKSDELVRFPQLLFAPCLVALIWSSLFQTEAPLDVEGMLDTHVSLLLKALKPSTGTEGTLS